MKRNVKERETEREIAKTIEKYTSRDGSVEFNYQGKLEREEKSNVFLVLRQYLRSEYQLMLHADYHSNAAPPLSLPLLNFQSAPPPRNNFSCLQSDDLASALCVHSKSPLVNNSTTDAALLDSFSMDSNGCAALSLDGTEPVESKQNRRGHSRLFLSLNKKTTQQF